MGQNLITRERYGPRNILTAGLLAVILLWVSAPAWASQGNPSTQAVLEQTAPPPLPRTTGPIITDNAVNIPVKTWSLQVTPILEFLGGNFGPHWQRGPLPGNYRSLQVPAQLYYSPTPRLEVSAGVPFIQNWAANVGPANQAADFGSLGDTSLTFRYMFPNAASTAAQVTGYLSVLFPTGHASPLEPKLLGTDQTGGGAFAFTWGFDVFKYVPQVPVLLYANIWYTNYADGWVNRTRVYYPDQVTVNLAMEVPLKNSPNNRVAFLLEAVSTWGAGRMMGRRANQASTAIVSVLPALEFIPTSWFALALGVQVDLIGKNIPFAYTPTLACFINF